MTPFSPPHNHFTHPKPLTNTNNTNNNSTTTATHPQQFCYEPTSVLELRRSPSPVLGGGGGGSANLFTGLSDNNTHINWDDQNHILHHTNNHHQIPPPIDDDWDSMMLGLEEDHHHDHEDSSSEKDDSTFPFKYSPPPQFTTTFDEQPHSHNNIIPSPTIILNQNNLEFDCSQLDQLIRAAASVESNDLHLAQVILARLNQTALISPTGKPLQRAAFYFKEALQLLLSSSSPSHHLSNSEIVHKIKAYKSFSEISPITMFANFTANQAFLEALEGSMFIHIIDFEIGLGGHWASFMQELASKRKSRNHNTSQHYSLRITAVILEEASVGGEAKLIRENLQHFAQQLGIHFHLEFLLFNSFQLLLFNAIRFINGEVVALNLSPSVFHNLRTSDSIAAFLRFLPRISPRITVFVDEDGCSRDFVATPSSSFRRNFVTGLEFYSSLLESLEGANYSGDRELIPRIETLLLRPKIAGMVAAAAANCILPCREMLSSVGMVPVRFSEFTDTQAEWLVRRAQVRGFHVVKRQGVMLLCWHESELVATSAWRVS